MKYCTHCGKQVKDEAVVCTECGCPIESAKPKKSTAKKGSSFDNDALLKLVPIFGLVLMGIGALHFLTSFIYWICEVAKYAFSGFTHLLGNGLLTYLRTPLMTFGVGLLLYTNSKK